MQVVKPDSRYLARQLIAFEKNSSFERCLKSSATREKGEEGEEGLIRVGQGDQGGWDVWHFKILTKPTNFPSWVGIRPVSLLTFSHMSW